MSLDPRRMADVRYPAVHNISPMSPGRQSQRVRILSFFDLRLTLCSSLSIFGGSSVSSLRLTLSKKIFHAHSMIRTFITLEAGSRTLTCLSSLSIPSATDLSFYHYPERPARNPHSMFVRQKAIPDESSGGFKFYALRGSRATTDDAAGGERSNFR